jgi:hypothetical protein
MKPILMIMGEIDLPETNLIKIKKNRTIIKDRRYFKGSFYSEHNYKFLLEEWEVWNESRLQICLSNNGFPLRPVHIVDIEKQKDGISALFQTEKMLVLRCGKGVFELSKNKIDDYGNVDTTVLQVGSYNTYSDIRQKLDAQFHTMMDEVLTKINKYNTIGYVTPLYYDTDEKDYRDIQRSDYIKKEKNNDY